MQNISYPKGDELSLDLAFSRAGVPIDLTDAYILFTAKLRSADADAEAVVQRGTTNTGKAGIAVTDPLEGTATLTIPAGSADGLATTVLTYDIQLQVALGAPVETVALGNFFVIPTVTEETFA